MTARNYPKGIVACPDCGGPKTKRSRRCMVCDGILRKRRIDETPVPDDLNRPLPMPGSEAAVYGAITTLENAEGHRLVVHRTGSVKAAVREACRVALKQDPTFQVICVSTPTSVYTDLQGARLEPGHSITKNGLGARPQLPETVLGLGELLHERLR